MKTFYRTLAGAIGLAAVAGQYLLLIEGKSGAALLTSSVHFFSFFTILTNILAAVALLAPVVAPGSALSRFLDRPPVRTAIVGYIVIVGTVYYTLLRNLENARARSGGGMASTRSRIRLSISPGRLLTVPLPVGIPIHSSMC